ncbi:lipase 1 isoform X2 [Manihot esculenta]|uniref:lipase 1 isoform X2 n=1 Tax=Manihot esculenta TaxID=3983 RepID=UPI001CC6DBF8|nr:lipase 1 isoform X2 [Manihot esculenta]
MAKCFSFTALQDSCYRYSFSRAGLKSFATDLGDGTVMHCWVPKTHVGSKPTLLLIHGFGANAMWQFNHFIPQLKSTFNVYVPDLLFFGDSHTTRPERTEAFQAQCVMALMDALNVTNVDLMGMSYGGFVAYSIAAQFKERVGRVVLGCAGVCLGKKDTEKGLFQLSVDDAINILMPQNPDKVRELVRLSFHKPPPTGPNCFLNDFIEVMCTEYRQEKKELIQALHEDRELSNLPKITQPTLIIWGEYDQIFPVVMAHTLKRLVWKPSSILHFQGLHSSWCTKTKKKVQFSDQQKNYSTSFSLPAIFIFFVTTGILCFLKNLVN